MRGGEVEEPGWFGQIERVKDGLLTCGGRGALGDVAVVGGESDQVEPVEFVTQVAPGVAGGVLEHSQQQREPAQLDVGADTASPQPLTQEAIAFFTIRKIFFATAACYEM